MCDCCKEKKEKFYITTPIYYPSESSTSATPTAP